MKMNAFLFDMNGTIIDDMRYHVSAWQGIVNELGANISMEQMKEECYGKNAELLERIFPGRFDESEKERLGIEKEKKYREYFRPYLKLLPGLGNFLNWAWDRKIIMGIGSSAIIPNIDFVLDGLGIRNFFSAIVSADDVVHSKPDPETFLKCAELLKANPCDCIVFEDSPKGVETALNAGMKAVVLTTMHEVQEFEHYSNIICFAKDFTGIERDLLHYFSKIEKSL